MGYGAGGDGGEGGINLGWKTQCAMTPKAIFGLIVRTFGLSLLIYAVYTLFYCCCAVLRIFESRLNPVAYLVTGTLFLIIGLYLLRGAPGLIRFSYPERKTIPEPTENGEHDLVD